ncbi:MAG: sensor histidine kinase, partial [Pseudomonadota bacterium]
VLDHLAENAIAHHATDLLLRQLGEEVWVKDNGSGIPEGMRARIFDPFFTSRRDSGGTGMGLTIVSSILSAHNARITSEPSETGARFVLRFGEAGSASRGIGA